LSFKPETDDIREAPALVLIDQLLAAGAKVAAHDPAGMPNVRAKLGDAIELSPDIYSAAAGADALVLMTEWHSFRRPDFRRLKQSMRQALVFDARNVWLPDELKELGFRYFGIGRR
jgi:UDPglucose 6-dehydrogenase